MFISTSAGYALSAVTATAVVLLAGCSGGSPQVAPLSNPGASTKTVSRYVGKARPITIVPNGPTHYSHRVTKSWMKRVDATTRLTYVSDFDANNVTVYGRDATVVGQIGGFNSPQALFVDSNRNLWVTNFESADIEVFPRGATSPSMILNDPDEFPADVTVCPNGTVYVSNFYSVSAFGSISVYAPGNTNPTGSLVYPGELYNFFITCDAAGNVFTDLDDDNDVPTVVEYAGGRGPAIALPITGILFPGGIKPNDAGNLLVDDQVGQTITEYTEAGAPTGNSISTGSGDIVDIGVTRDSRVVGGADATLIQGSSFRFPSGAHRQTYPDDNGHGAFPVGFAFDPGQKGLGN